MNIRFLRSALPDLRWFKRYYMVRFPEGRRKADEHFLKTVELLRANPRLGHPIDDLEGVRIHSIPRTPFAFVYRLAPDAVEVMRVLDGRSEDANDLL